MEGSANVVIHAERCPTPGGRSLDSAGPSTWSEPIEPVLLPSAQSPSGYIHVRATQSNLRAVLSRLLPFDLGSSFKAAAQLASTFRPHFVCGQNADM